MRSFLYLVLCCCLLSCRAHPVPPAEALSPEEEIRHHLDTLKKIATTGDLIVRLGDDILSYQIRYMNIKDRSYSHAGMIVDHGGQKMVAHITPDVAGADTIQYIPIDSFLNTERNVKCALYRYALSPAERDSLKTVIEGYKQQDVRFDRIYQMESNDKMYCSEMIAKALSKATKGRIVCREVNIPAGMQRLVLTFFKKEHATPEMIAQWKFISLDNLYLIPQCSLLMQFPLKFFP